jgi:hypothetical protein
VTLNTINNVVGIVPSHARQLNTMHKIGNLSHGEMIQCEQFLLEADIWILEIFSCKIRYIHCYSFLRDICWPHASLINVTSMPSTMCIRHDSKDLLSNYGHTYMCHESRVVSHDILVILRATSHTRLRGRDHYTSSTLIGGKGGASPSSLHTTLERPTKYVNARWM